ncbi:MAG: ABC transporter ATP-binding protein [Alphaproteobacteria bacterium CG_4_10_14_0_2_um_filter_63_37]|nr:MAG: ABC transporter ATP-binding protein [Alphaproteobacteria bacterium CG_4_10_14_0_2_um_filter_63_37]
MIRLNQVVKRFEGRLVTDHVSANFPQGKVSVILGGSGSGKSTLLRQMTGLLPPDGGMIEIDGQDVPQLGRRDLYRLRQRLGMLFQNGALLNAMNVFENIAFPMRAHTNLSERMIRIIVGIKLEMVGLRGTEHLMASELSGGMVKRVALARAIALDPPVMFFDEPFSGLDPISAGVIEKLILDYKKIRGATCVVVSHDIPSTFRMADHIIILSHGRVIAQGSAQEIQQSPHPEVQQFIQGLPDGPIRFRYPAQAPLQDDLMQRAQRL